MKLAAHVARIALGLIFTVFGANYFFHFIPMHEMPEAAGKFMMGLGGSGYFFPFMKTIEIVCGLLLLAGVYVPLALTVLAPIVVNIFLFHLFLAPGGMAVSVALLALELFVAWSYRSKFAGVLSMK